MERFNLKKKYEVSLNGADYFFTTRIRRYPERNYLFVKESKVPKCKTKNCFLCNSGNFLYCIGRHAPEQSIVKTFYDCRLINPELIWKDKNSGEDLLGFSISTIRRIDINDFSVKKCFDDPLKELKIDFLEYCKEDHELRFPQPSQIELLEREVANLRAIQDREMSKCKNHKVVIQYDWSSNWNYKLNCSVVSNKPSTWVYAGYWCKNCGRISEYP